MRCTRCSRWLVKATATVTSTDGAAHYGPVCAVAMGLLQARVVKRRAVSGGRRGRRRCRDERQMELLGATT